MVSIWMLTASVKVLCCTIVTIFCLTCFLKPMPAYSEGLPLNSRGIHQNKSPTVVAQSDSTSIVYGEMQPLGEGSMRTWVKLDKNGNPSDIGVSMTEASLYSLPKENDDFGDYPVKLQLQDGIGCSTFEYELLFPKDISAPPFTHVALNTNPHGHGPPNIYDAAHLDVHFNFISPEERRAITEKDHDAFVEKAYKQPSVDLLPFGYKTVAKAAEPRMGTHWFNFGASEFHGSKWEKSFNIGSYNGKIVFWEPMISIAYLETKPNVTLPIKQPLSYPQTGYYPTEYSINYKNGEYLVSLNNLKYRLAEFAANPNSEISSKISGDLKKDSNSTQLTAGSLMRYSTLETVEN
jgi:hypothetical protein